MIVSVFQNHQANQTRWRIPFVIFVLYFHMRKSQYFVPSASPLLPNNWNVRAMALRNVMFCLAWCIEGYFVQFNHKSQKFRLESKWNCNFPGASVGHCGTFWGSPFLPVGWNCGKILYNLFMCTNSSLPSRENNNKKTNHDTCLKAPCLAVGIFFTELLILEKHLPLFNSPQLVLCGKW